VTDPAVATSWITGNGDGDPAAAVHELAVKVRAAAASSQIIFAVIVYAVPCRAVALSGTVHTNPTPVGRRLTWI
jgi:hypothetical protein